MFTIYINGVELHPTFETLIGLQSRKRNTLMQIQGAITCAGGVPEITENNNGG